MITNTVTDLGSAFIYLFVARPELIWFLAFVLVAEFIVISKLNHLTWTRVLGNWAMISLIMGTFQIGRWLIVGDLTTLLPQGLVLSAWIIMFTVNMMAGVLLAKLAMEGTRSSRIAFYRWLAERGNAIYASSTQKAILLEQKPGNDKYTIAARKAEVISQAKRAAGLKTTNR